ncbi:diguanylate cyclase [Aliivibrio kagoshimensis]|uniref:sensor domain-containing diguanylate cyclase n=1 Tax=Aliivibrio kagoshimensis TaxID=2910230 RepID=UPI003D128FA6
MSNRTTSEKVIRHLYEITNSFKQGFDYQIDELLRMGLERLNLDIGILSNIKGSTYTVNRCVVPEGVEMKPGDQFTLEGTYCSLTCQSNSPIAVEHVGEDIRYKHHPAYESFGLESYIGIPIYCHDEFYGTLNFSSAEPYDRQFSQADIDVLELMASWIGVELARRKQEQTLEELNQKLKHQALHDSLTNIANRRGMFKHLNKDLNRLIRNDGYGYIAIIDIDFFKRINDTYGHQVGDDVLAEIGNCLKLSIRNYDFVARLGGEEFLLWLPDTGVGQEHAVIKRIIDNIAQIEITDEPITVSIGACSFSFKNQSSVQTNPMVNELISTADEALYSAKESGRNCVKVVQVSY